MSTTSSLEEIRPGANLDVAATSDSPYVGPRPFLPTDGRYFFGRDREAIDLKHRVMAHPITLLYSMSGAGKTSLINARLVPDLQGEGCLVLPPARVRGLSWKLDPAEIPNIYVFHAVMSWQSHADVHTAGLLKSQTLKDEITPKAKLAEDNDSLVIAVFDQFEELFTAYSSRWGDRLGFFEQLSGALESISNLRVVIAMREDYVASVDPYASLMQENLRTRFRLERLRRESALEAVINPLKGTGRRFAPGVANKLIDSLMTIHVRPPRAVARGRSDNVDSDLLAGSDGESSSVEIPATTPETLGFVATSEYVEPVQLQVVCQNLWSNIGPEEVEITAVHLAECGDVDQALSRFYENCIKETTALTKSREGRIRRWFAEELITPAGTRGLVLRGPNHTGKLPNEAVDMLESRHLIHGEDRGGARWYELSHDRFLMPIINSNLRWQRRIPSQALFSELQDRAVAWDSAPDQKKPSLLLCEADLARAEAWKKSVDSDDLGLSDPLEAFLKASRTAIEAAKMAAQLEAERRAARVRKWLIGGLIVGVSILGLAVVYTNHLYDAARTARAHADDNAIKANAAEKEAEDQAKASHVAENRATASRLAMQGAVDSQPSEKIGHILEAMELSKKIRRTVPERDDKDKNGPLTLIRKTLSKVHQRSQLGDEQHEITDVAFAPRKWGLTLRRNEFYPVVALAGKNGHVELWDLGDYDNPADDEPLSNLPPIEPLLSNPGKTGSWISRVVFHPGGQDMLAFGTGYVSSVQSDDRGGAWVWIAPELAGGKGRQFPLGNNGDGPVADIAFSPDGKLIAVAGFKKIDEMTLGRKPGTKKDGVWDGTVQIYETATLKPLYDAPFAVKGPAQSVAFDRRGERLVVASGDRNGTTPNLPGQVVVFNVKDTQRPTPIVMEDCDNPSIRAAFSPDGKVVVSGGGDRIGRVHDPKTGQLLATLAGHLQPITALNFSHDGTLLVTASGDRTARIWNPPSWYRERAEGTSPPSWTPRVTLVGHTAALTLAEFSPDGSLVLTGGYDRDAKVWDAQTGECVVTHVGNRGTVNVARFLARGFLLATAGGDGTARIWTTGNVETPRLLLASHGTAPTDVASSAAHVPGHDAALRDVEFRPGKEGRYQALTTGADGVACLWEVSNLETPRAVYSPIRRFAPPEPRAGLTDSAFSPDGEQVATASLDGTVRIWDAESGRELRVIRAGPGEMAPAALGVTFSPRSGIYLLTSWADGKMRLFRRDGEDWRSVGVWTGSAFRLTPQLFDKDERLVVTPNSGVLRVTGETGSVNLWDVGTNKREKLGFDGGLGPVTDLAVHPKTGQIAAAMKGPAGSVVVWDLDHGRYRQIGQPVKHPAGVERLAFNPDGTILATEAEDGIGRLWTWPILDGQTPRAQSGLTGSLVGLTGPSPMLAFSSNGSHLVSDGGYLATDAGATMAQVWQLSGKTTAALKGPRDRLVALAFGTGETPEILSLNRENRLQRWSLKDDEKGEPLGSCRGPNHVPTAAALAVRPGGDIAASGTDSGMIKLWWTHTGDEAAELKAHSSRVTTLAFSADGSRLVSADRDGRTYVWKVPDRDARAGASPLTPLASFNHDRQPVSVARFLDNQRVVTGTGDSEPQRWHADPDLMNAREIPSRFTRFDLAGRGEAKSVELHSIAREFSGRESPLGAVVAAVSPGDGRVFVGTAGPQPGSNLINAFDRPDEENQKATTSYLGHTDPILDLTVSADGSHIATASADNTARVWEVPAEKDARFVELRGHSGDVSSVAFSPDGRYVVTVSRQDGTARVWDRSGGEPLYVLGTRRAGLNSATMNEPPGPRQYTDDVVAASFSSDGKMLVTAHGDGNARVYRLELCGGFDELKNVAERRLEGLRAKTSNRGSAR